IFNLSLSNCLPAFAVAVAPRALGHGARRAARGGGSGERVAREQPRQLGHTFVDVSVHLLAGEPEHPPVLGAQTLLALAGPAARLPARHLGRDAEARHNEVQAVGAYHVLALEPHPARVGVSVEP